MAERDADFVAFATEASGPLFRSAWLMSGDWHAAQDLVQETLAKMYRGWASVDQIDNPLAYAHVVLSHTFLSRRRRRSSSEQPSAAVAEVGVDGPDVALRQTLVDALLTLPERDRVVLVLRYLADRSVDEVARDVGRSPAAVRVQAMRALAKLRAALGAQFFELTDI